jgi:hypothetical protein
MSLFCRSLLISVIALGLTAPVVAQPKADAGSGPTKGAVSTDDAGSGPTKGVKPNSGTNATSTSNGSTDNSAGVTPGPKSTGGSQPVTPITPEKKQ